ncbi:hypothetical protein L1887_19031 [Cichorium endivia]|nr:hypothetical protein L1887_19031 [Cichorium endivia]
MPYSHLAIGLYTRENTDHKCRFTTINCKWPTQTLHSLLLPLFFFSLTALNTFVGYRRLHIRSNPIH